MNKLSLLTFRYMKVNMKRTITTCIGVIVSAILIYMIFSIGYSIYFSESEENYKDYYLMCDGIIECDGKTAKEIVNSADYYGGEDNAAGIKLSYAWAAHIDDNRDDVIYINDFLAMPRKLTITKGTFPKNENSVLIPNWLGTYGQSSIGSKYDIEKGFGADTENSKVVSGLYDTEFMIPTSNENLLSSFMGAVLIKSDDIVFNSEKVYLFVTFKESRDIRESLKTLASVYDIEKYELSEVAETYYKPETDLSYTTFRAFLMLLAFIGIIISVVIIRNAFNISVHTRSKDYGVLRCIGMSRRQIIVIILGEALVISLIGLIFGLIIGHGISLFIFGLFKKSLKLSSFYILRLIPEAFFFSVISVAIATFYSMISPIEKLYRINPVSAIRMTDEYKISEKNIKAKRGKVIGRLFGVEAGYAYKNILRDKKRFLLLTVTLIIWTILATAVLTTISGTKKFMYDLLAPLGKYDGSVEFYSEKEEKSIRDKINATNEIEAMVRVDISFFSNDDKNLFYLCYGFPEEKYNKFTQIAEGYSKNQEGLDVIVYKDENKDPGDTVYGNVKIAGEINDYDKFSEVFGDYISFRTVDTSFTRMLIYNIDDEKAILNELKPVSQYYTMMVEFKNELKHLEFDKFIEDSGYYFDNYFEEYQLFMDAIKVVKTAVVTFLIFVFILYMINTINTNSSEMLLRKSEINILRTIGMSKKQVDKMLYLEGIIVSIIASVIGNIIGSVAGNFMVYFMLFAGQDEEDGVKFVPHIDVPGILFVIIILLIINIFAVWITKPEDDDIIFD